MSEHSPGLEFWDVDKSNGAYFCLDRTKIQASFHSNGKLSMCSSYNCNTGYAEGLRLDFDREGYLTEETLYKENNPIYQKNYQRKKVSRYYVWKNHEPVSISVVKDVNIGRAKGVITFSDESKVEFDFHSPHQSSPKNGVIKKVSFKNSDGLEDDISYKFDDEYKVKNKKDKNEGTRWEEFYDEGVLISEKTIEERGKVTRHVFCFGEEATKVLKIPAKQLDAVKNFFDLSK